MPFKIAFVDPARGDYTPETPRHRPLGGSQSALCYLARALAAAGLSVTLVNGTRTPGHVHGVHCRSMASVSLDDLGGFDAVVLLNGCAPDLPARLRAVLGSAGKLILWMQHAVDEPAAEMLADPRARACWDGFAFVSLWQMETYLAAFGLDRGRCRVLRNGIAPAFAGLFPAGIDIAATKPWPPVLAYTSAPFRGLDVLLDSVARIRADIPGTTLRVFSSLEGYQVPAEQDPYRDLYRRCRETEGVEYVGAVSQDALAHALREATALAYLNRFAETSCIAVMEALAAGCLVLSSRLGALPETGAGFARLIPVPADAAEHARRFAEVARTALAEQHADPAAADRRLRAQVDHVNARMTWTVAARAWREWLEEPRRETPCTLARAESCLDRADHDEARELCRLVLAVTPAHGAAWRLLSQALTAGARYTDAGRALVRAGTTGGPPPFHQDLAKGLVQGDDGRPVGERIAVIEALAQGPLLEREALAAMAGRLASEALLAGDFSAALRAYRLRLALRPGDARTRLATAWPLTRLGRHDEAMAAIERALSEDAGTLLANREAMALVASCVEEAETAVHGAVAGPGPGSGGGDA
ncbi:MAG TPA: glycosyltransferase, partial [Azospirillum sp.]